MSEAKNVDDVIVASMNSQAPVQAIPEVKAPIQQEEKKDPVLEVSNNEATEETNNNSEPQKSPEEEKPQVNEKSSIDEYGNPVEKEKTYTEEEVQRMIRDRLSRGRNIEPQPTQQQVQQDTKGFTADPNSEQPWDVQLEQFIERTLEKRQAKMTEKQWKDQQNAIQSDFESKFSSGLEKYPDFRKIVANKPITDSMMMATRNLDNPAAFIYGASKMHPQELERISRIADPYSQAAEIGRLHERMVKNRNNASNAPKPVEAPKGDLPNKNYTPPPIDQRIHEYAKQKRR